MLTRDTWGSDIVDELTPHDSDTVVYKTRFSGFYRTELDELLQTSQIKHLIVTGCTTSICVESTIRDAFYRGYHCIVLEDCTAEPMGADLSRSNHDATILLVERIFGSVTSSTTFINALHEGSQRRRARRSLLRGRLRGRLRRRLRGRLRRRQDGEALVFQLLQVGNKPGDHVFCVRDRTLGALCVEQSPEVIEQVVGLLLGLDVLDFVLDLALEVHRLTLDLVEQPH